MSKIIKKLSSLMIIVFYLVALIFTDYNTIVFIIGTVMLILLAIDSIYKYHNEKFDNIC